jgi:hypothetical protein
MAPLLTAIERHAVPISLAIAALWLALVYSGFGVEA